MDNIESILDQATTLLQKVYGLPAASLVVISCVVLGYALRYIKAFPNQGIPLAVILWGAVFFPIIADDNNDLTLRVWLVRNVLVGLVLGFVAWIIHNKIISKIEDKLGPAPTPVEPPKP